jgi:hypothetical protein
MRFPSFVRLPKHQKFHFEPRYYDPIKEDIEQRINLVKNEKSHEGNTKTSERISAIWERNKRQSRQSSIRQILIMFILVSGVCLYFYFGNTGIYILIGLISLVYLSFRIKKATKKD